MPTGKLSPGGYRRHYLRRWIPGRGLVYEHRYVMETLLGRMLLPGEQVHHINGDTKDNRPENLELHANQLGHLRRHRKADDSAVISLYCSGLSCAQVGSLLGVNDTTVYRTVKEAGKQRTLSQAASIRPRTGSGTFARS